MNNLPEILCMMGQIGLLFSDVYIGSIMFDLPTDRLTQSATKWLLKLIMCEDIFPQCSAMFAFLLCCSKCIRAVDRSVGISVWLLRI